MSELKPYIEIKPSGVVWLGEVPSHWNVRRLRNIADVRFSNVDKHSKKHETAVRLCNYSDVYHNDRIRSNMNFMRATATDDEVNRFRLVTGDVLITKDSETWNDIGVPAFVESTDRNLVCGYHLALIRPKTTATCGEFLSAALSSSIIASQLHVRANGVTRFGLSQNAIKSTYLPVPPLTEQTAIARFLDHTTNQIDRYIRAKQKLIALLEEQKQTIIHQAVTGQIDVRTGQPYPEYKPSGVEWLGDVPRHWDVTALRFRYSQCLGKMLDTKKITGEYLVPYLRNIDVQWDHINLQELPSMDILPTEYGRYTVRSGDLLVCEGGEVGRCAIWSGGLNLCGFQKALHRLRPRDFDRDLPRFMCYSLRTAVQRNAFDDGHESTISHLTGDKLRAHRFPFPTRDEQERLVNYLDIKSKSVDHGIACAQSQIGLLREYRTRLIADVVTGKLDVREAAAELPQIDPKSHEDGVNSILSEQYLLTKRHDNEQETIS